MAVTYYVKSGSGALELTNRTWSLGDRMVPAIADASSNFAIGRSAVWECTTGGTSNGTPTWPASVTYDTTTVTQNGVVWKARQPGFSSGTTANWTFATTHLGYIPTSAVNTTIYVSNNHAESVAAPYTAFATNQLGMVILCVDDSAAPPTAEATTATITTTGTGTLTLTGISGSADLTYVKGLKLLSGSGSSTTCNIALGNTYLENCDLKLLTTGGSSQISWGSGVGFLKNCNALFSAAGQTLSVGNGYYEWRGGALLAGGTTPTALAIQNWDVFENFDLTQASASINLQNASSPFKNRNAVRDIRMPASWSGSINAATMAAGVSSTLYNGDYNSTNYILNNKQGFGTINQETTIVRTSGASDGTTAISWKLVATSTAGKFPCNAIVTPEIDVWVPAGTVTVTVEIVSSASVNNDEFWIEVTGMVTSGAPLGTSYSSAKTNILAAGSAVTTSAAPWTSSPATPVYQKAAVTFTTTIAGYVHLVGKLCKASKTLYMDPKPTVTGQASSFQRQIPGGAFINESVSGYPASRMFTGM